MSFAATFLPAYRKDGSVRAWALLDASDYEWAKERRWYIAKDGYFYRNLSKVEGDGHIALHREILDLPKGDRRREGDHINRDRLDNRRCNLRIADRSGNLQNAGRRCDSRLGRGVKFHKNCKSRPWQARYTLRGKEHSLGYFATQEEAADAALGAREQHMPFSTD